MKLRIAYTEGVRFNDLPSESAEGFERGQDDFVFICPSFLECVLAVGTAGDVSALRDWLAALPHKSYGRVFVEIESPEQMQPLSAPPGVGVTWLLRSAGEPGGAALIRAVEGWFDEWVRGDPLSGRHVRLWAGASELTELTGYWNRLQAELCEIWEIWAQYREQHA